MGGTKQHYVPRYYLKNFAKGNKIFVFDKVKKKYLNETGIPIKDVAYSNNFYDIENEDISQFLLEKTNNKTFVDDIIEEYNERISAPLIDSFINIGEVVYKNKDIELMSVINTYDIIDFLVVQLFRTPFFRKQFEIRARDIKKNGYEGLVLKEQYTEERIARLLHGIYIISAICNTEIWKNSKEEHLLKPKYKYIDTDVINMVEQLKKMKKMLMISSIDRFFSISDNPIYIKQSKENKIQMIYFPITKRCAMTFLLSEEIDKQILVINNNTEYLLNALNELMEDWAYRYIYTFEKE